VQRRKQQQFLGELVIQSVLIGATGGDQVRVMGHAVALAAGFTVAAVGDVLGGLDGSQQVLQRGELAGNYQDDQMTEYAQVMQCFAVVGILLVGVEK